MSFDAWVVAFGLSRLLQELQLVEGDAAYLVLVGVGPLDIWLLYRFFSKPHLAPPPKHRVSRVVQLAIAGHLLTVGDSSPLSVTIGLW